MSCCFPFRVCCPPDEHETAVAAAIRNAMYRTHDTGAEAEEGARNAAEALLAVAELAPRGLTAAVIEAWPQDDAALGAAVRKVLAPAFAEAALKGHSAG